MQGRMKNPVYLIPSALEALQALHAAAEKGGIDKKTLAMIELRASQINGCSVCVDMHARQMKRSGESDERLFAVAAWRHTPWFTDAERAALGLTECLTRIADRGEAVPDDVWAEAARHYDEKALAGLILAIANINVWNRINGAVGQIAGEWKGA
jgi:AhpD family alkylhydroperoxidase